MAEKSLLIHQRAEQERKRREEERKKKDQLLKIQATAGPPAIARKRRGLNFHEPGTFINEAEQLRRKLKLEALQKKIAARSSKLGIDADKVVEVTTNKQQLEEEVVPDFEWWDRPLLKGRSLDDVVTKLNQYNVKPEELFEGVITNLVEHPSTKKPPGPGMSVIKEPIILLPKERKKLRRQNRRAIELEKQEKIKIGLIPKPEPKLKRSNIMYALGEEAIMNPTKAEQLVREQEEQRQQAHLEHNQANKLTLEEKRAKKLRKIQEDLSVVGTWVAIYKVSDLSAEAHKFKVSKNAKQLTMTGVVILNKDLNVVVVEGGPKQQRKFKHLMLDRIQWGASECKLIWEGQVGDRAFNKFKVHQMNNEADIRDMFKKAGVEHYWDISSKTKDSDPL